MSAWGQVDGRDTEWIIAQRKIGNAPPVPEKEKEYVPELGELDREKKEGRLGGLSKDEQDDLMDDTYDEEETKILQELREKRIKEMKEQAMRLKFGRVLDIGSDQYINEVSQANEGVYVVVHLYATGSVDSKKVDSIMSELAYQHINTKFVRIKGCLAIQDYPDHLCPTILIYQTGKLLKQFIGLKEFGGLEDCSRDTFEWVLAGHKALETKIKKNPLEKQNFNGFKFNFQMK